jgi:hypothetical protein
MTILGFGVGVGLVLGFGVGLVLGRALKRAVAGRQMR